tara:strand:+ start:1419 stop:1931 length:513 start_codon:yes stop_codon:yes gene_type:complete
MIKSIQTSIIKNTLIYLLVCGIFLFYYVSEAFAKRPPEIRNQQDLDLKQDMHGQDLSGNEFVKFDLNGFNFSESNLQGAVFNNSKLNNATMNGANLTDALAYATDFTGADLSDVNFTNALLMESNFDGAKIDGADFTDAVLSRIQQKELCAKASGTNPNTGESTEYSLGC